MSEWPNFLYIGTSKAGSTWIYRMLDCHPEVFLAPGKGAYYFCAHYDRGWDWYRGRFVPGPEQRAVGEISHTYMASEAACRRIADRLPSVKLVACVRDPVERAFSDYLDGVKNGLLTGTFEEELERVPELVDIGRYGSQIQRYLEHFPREQLHVAVFDELSSQAAEFARKIHEFLEITPIELPPSLQGQRLMPAGTPRSKAAAQLAKRVSRRAKRFGLKRVVGRVKTSVWVRDLLYRQYTRETRPTMKPETRRRLRGVFAPEVELMDDLLGTDLVDLWRYSEAAETCSA